MTVDSTADSILILSQAYYPGWQVEIDGHSADLLRADAMFQGVAVGRGHHTVRFTFRSASICIGAIVSMLSLPSRRLFKRWSTSKVVNVVMDKAMSP